MKMVTIKKHAMALAALAIAASSVTVMSFSSNGIQAPTTLYFHGNTQSATEVADPARWTEVDNEQPCGSGEIAACSMEVDESDVTGTPGSRQLNPLRIQLDANSTGGAHYVPSKSSTSSSPNLIFETNKQP